MATQYFRTRSNYANVGSSRWLVIGESTATQVFVDSGYSAMYIFNHGSANIIWGASSVKVNSGNYLYPSGLEKFENIQGDFSVYLISDSFNTNVTVTCPR